MTAMICEVPCNHDMPSAETLGASVREISNSIMFYGVISHDQFP